MSDQAKAPEMGDEERATFYCKNAAPLEWTIRMRDAYLAGIKFGEEKRQAEVELLRDALDLADNAISALLTTQKKEGLGLLGELLAPSTLEKIRAALAGKEEK